MHHSGSGWLARPSPWGTFTSYSLPAFLAHSATGHSRRVRSRQHILPFPLCPETGRQRDALVETGDTAVCCSPLALRKLREGLRLAAQYNPVLEVEKETVWIEAGPRI